MHRQLILLIILLIMQPSSLIAQDAIYPTVDELNQVILPPYDPVDIARRLWAINAQMPIAEAPPIWEIGDTQFFSVVDTASQREFAVETQLRGMSENVLLWIEATAPITEAVAQQFVQVVDAGIYQQVQDLWGVHEPGGIDHDPRLYIVMVSNLDTSVAGYFAEVHSFPREVAPNSNQHEMMIFNLSAIPNFDILNPSVLTTIAHEYQHILRHFVDSNEGTWLDEGFSTFTEHHLGWDAGRSQVVAFLNRPNVQLNQWIADTNRFPRYGGVFLFINYFTERFGLDALRQLSDEPLDNWHGLDAVLQDLIGISADDFFADWVLANYLRDIATGYGYQTLANDIPSARPLASIVNYPYQVDGQLQQYSTDYYTAFNFGDATTLTVNLTQADTAPLIPTTAFDGDFFYYAVPADSTDLTLTRRVDLSNVEAAALTFRTWYDIEEFWDYAYVVVSRDDGTTWDILSGTTSRDRNPYNRAYGEGYTGKSFGWVQETISLDDYAGDEILIRFEMITDAATVSHGMAIDDLRIDAIGYVDSFEATDDTWDAQGWIRTDNRLPQRTWVQVVQQVGKTVTVSRWLTDDAESTWTIDLIDNVELVLIAISPIAPQTMIEAQYTLDIMAN